MISALRVEKAQIIMAVVGISVVSSFLPLTQNGMTSMKKSMYYVHYVWERHRFFSFQREKNLLEYKYNLSLSKPSVLES